MELPVILALGVIAVLGVVGYRDGIVKRVLQTAGLLVVIIFPARYAGQLTPWVMERTGTDEGVALLLAWVGMAVAGLIISRIVAHLISKFVQWTILGWLDRLAGAVLGVIIGVLLSSLALMGASEIPGGESVRESCHSSGIGRFIYNAVPDLYLSAREKYGTDAGEILSDAMKDAKQKVNETTEDLSEEAKEKAEELGDKALEKAAETAKEVVEEKVGL
jgi:uncharacterized membrane protein required for colicin V production